MIENGDNLIISLEQALDIIKDQPRMEFLWFGIPRVASVNLIAAPPKVGKSIWAENFTYALIDQQINTFLGMPIKTVDKVVILSWEEHLISRSMRQRNQLNAYQGDLDTSSIASKVFVLNGSSVSGPSDEKYMETIMVELKAIKPDVLIIDSLGRLSISLPIEESMNAQRVMLSLREMSNTLNIPVIVLHHTVKTKRGNQIELASMAGSRVVGQEADSVFTIEKREGGGRAMRPLALRYSGDDNEVIFRINDDCLVVHVSDHDVSESNPKIDKLTVLNDFIKENCSVTSNELEDYVHHNRLMSRSSLYESLKKLPVIKEAKGSYIHSSCVKLDNKINI